MVLHALEDLEHYFQFSIHLAAEILGNNYRYAPQND